MATPTKGLQNFLLTQALGDIGSQAFVYVDTSSFLAPRTS